jgi:hypothetical protein
MELASCDFILLDCIRLGMEGAHVVDEAARNT